MNHVHRWASATVVAVGHSTRSFEELVALLSAHGVATLVDIRKMPRSRTNPQFNSDTLVKTLPTDGLSELHDQLSHGPPALMCAEALRWRCHRSLVADALVARGAEVLHLETAKRATPHRLSLPVYIGVNSKLRRFVAQNRNHSAPRREQTAALATIGRWTRARAWWLRRRKPTVSS